MTLLLQQTASRLAERHIVLRVTEPACDTLIDQGFSKEYGARALRREIQTQVEDRLAEALLTNRASQATRSLWMLTLPTMTLSCVWNRSSTAPRALIPQR